MKPGGGAWQGAIAAQQAKKTKVVRFEVSHSPTKKMEDLWRSVVQAGGPGLHTFSLAIRAYQVVYSSTKLRT